MVFSMGQLNQWVGQQLMGSGLVQVWPGMPVSEPLFDGDTVIGVRLVDQGVDRHGAPSDAYMPGMDVHAALTGMKAQRGAKTKKEKGRKIREEEAPKREWVF